jgi:putative addiction module killer protein
VEVRPLTVRNYVASDGSCPFEDWLDSVKDLRTRAQIDKRITRLRLGHRGEWDAVGEGVIELIFRSAGPGYRIYCGQHGKDLVILLGGGAKRGQQSDIENARKCWRDYLEENNA